MQVAEVLSHNELLPDHLRGKKNKAGKWEDFDEVQRRSICFSVVNAADLWGANAFMLAEQSYSVHGKMDYSGVFYIALANARGNLAEHLSHTFVGARGPDCKIIVSGRIRGEREPRTCELSQAMGEATGNSPSWKTDPELMMIYSGSRRWVRRHCPQVLLGLIPTDEPDDVPEASSEPTRTITHSDDDLVQYSWKIQRATTTDELKDIAELILRDDSLSKDERDLFLQQGRTAYSALSKAKTLKRKNGKNHLAEATAPIDEQQAEQLPSNAYCRWERTIKTEFVNDKLIEYLEEIVNDSDVSDKESGRLHDMINEQIEAVKVSAPQ